MFRFAAPWWLLALALAAAPVLAHYLRERGRRGGRLLYSDMKSLGRVGPTARIRARALLPWLEGLALGLAVVALARPQAGHRVEEVTAKGIDIVIALDVSGSMRAEDFAPDNRLLSAKRTVETFIDGRSSDRIGLITFARASETRCPPTLDYEALKTSLRGVSFAAPEDDGTAIGTGLTTALNRLRVSKAKSRVIVLLTDGINNAGSIDPLSAADLVHALGARAHVIGVGSDGPVTVPLPDGRRVKAVLPINEEELRQIAERTGGSYFRATDTPALEEVFRNIDAMEKTRIEVLSYGRYDERFAWVLGPSLALVAVAGALASTWLARIPS